MIRLVGLSEIDAIWPHFQEGFAEACRRGGGDTTPWYLFQNLRVSNMLLFVEEGLKAAFVVRPEKWGGEQVLRILACTGRDMAQWLPDLMATDVWKHHVGNMPVIFEGREGWRRPLSKYGVRVVRTLYRLN